MKLLVLGPTGGTGRQVVSQALAAGHDVTAFARTPDKVSSRHERLRVAAGDILDPGSVLGDAMRGQHAVVSALGCGMSFKPGALIARSVPSILSAMESRRVRRLIFTSAIGVGGTIAHVPLFPRLMARLPLRRIYADKLVGDDLIRESALEWTLVQPALLTDGPLTGTYRCGERLDLPAMPKISRADVAHFILTELEQGAHVRKTVLLAY